MGALIDAKVVDGRRTIARHHLLVYLVQLVRKYNSQCLFGESSTFRKRQTRLIKDGVPVGAAVTELRCNQGILSSQSDTAIPFLDHLEQAERAVDSVSQLLK